MEVSTTTIYRRQQDEPLYPFYHRRTRIVKSNASTGIQWPCNCTVNESVKFGGTGCIAAHVERKSGYLIAVKIPDRQDEVFTIAAIATFAKISEKLKKSFTVDNGKEFAAHKELAAGTGMKVFFCAPYSPWQRGTNENTNGLLRQFFPKGTSFDDLSEQQLQAAVDLINNRPRKRLGFRSPAELLLNFL